MPYADPEKDAECKRQYYLSEREKEEYKRRHREAQRKYTYGNDEKYANAATINRRYKQKRKKNRKGDSVEQKDDPRAKSTEEGN